MAVAPIKLGIGGVIRFDHEIARLAEPPVNGIPTVSRYVTSDEAAGVKRLEEEVLEEQRLIATITRSQIDKWLTAAPLIFTPTGKTRTEREAQRQNAKAAHERKIILRNLGFTESAQSRLNRAKIRAIETLNPEFGVVKSATLPNDVMPVVATVTTPDGTIVAPSSPQLIPSLTISNPILPKPSVNESGVTIAESVLPPEEEKTSKWLIIGVIFAAILFFFKIKSRV